MEKRNPRFLKVLMFIILSLPDCIIGQGKLAQTGLQFLEIGMSARAEAMGGAFTIAGNNAEALFYNPAGMTKNNTTYDVIINRVKWFADINYNSIGIIFKPFSDDFGVFGLSIQNADYGDFYGTRVVAGSVQGYEDTGIFSPTVFAIGLSYAKQLTDKFSIGGQAKYLKQTLGSNILTIGGSEKENSLSGFAFDFGMIYSTGLRGFDIGMSIKNFATDFKYEQYGFETPLTFRLGISIKVFELAQISDLNHDLLIVADAVHPRDYSEHLDIGAEYTLYKIISFRAGYKVNYSEQSFTGGIGLNYDINYLNVRINYSYGSFGIWDSVQRFSLGFSF